jgi:hypothetical protein
MCAEGTSWSLTCIYGPQSESAKLVFLEELKALSQIIEKEWLIVGDFNLITCASDKNNTNINRRLIGKFRAARDFMQLKEMRLAGRKFTCSNEQQNPVMTKIGHFFHTDEWDLLSLTRTFRPFFCMLGSSPLFLQGGVDC